MGPLQARNLFFRSECGIDSVLYKMLAVIVLNREAVSRQIISIQRQCLTLRHPFACQT